MENITNLSDKNKAFLVQAWGEEDEDSERDWTPVSDVPDVSRRDVPVGVQEARIKDFVEKVVSKLQVDINGIHNTYNSLLNNEKNRMQREWIGEDTRLKDISILRTYLRDAINNLRNLASDSGFEKEVFGGQ